jgi:hypothetical protein
VAEIARFSSFAAMAAGEKRPKMNASSSLPTRLAS